MPANFYAYSYNRWLKWLTHIILFSLDCHKVNILSVQKKIDWEKLIFGGVLVDRNSKFKAKMLSANFYAYSYYRWLKRLRHIIFSLDCHKINILLVQKNFDSEKCIFGGVLVDRNSKSKS